MKSNTAGLDLKELINLPHGDFAKLVRKKLDPQYGLDNEVAKNYKVNIHVERNSTTKSVYETIIKAVGEEHAKELGELAYQNGEAEHVSTDDYNDEEIWTTCTQID